MVGKNKRGRRGGHIFLRKTLGDAILRNKSALRLKGFFWERGGGSCLGSLGVDLVPLNIVV
jgi:hypothetical protein